MFRTKEISLVILFFGSAVSLQVSITPAQGEISVGESKFFQCEVVGGAKEIDWFSPAGEKIEPNRQDISVIRSDATSSTLTIYNAVIDNAGTYKCVASSAEQEAEATINVKIFQKITFVNAPSPQEFTEGDNANIVCDVTSSPPPTVIWKHKGSKIRVEKDVRFNILSNNHLQIRRIRKTDEGPYTCEGLIMARGEIGLRVIQVVVNVRPNIRIRQAEVNATADLGLSAVLACVADGFPEPSVTWARDGVPLVAGDKYGFFEEGMELSIKDVTKLDEGDYTCVATNKAGDSKQELSLKVFVQPNITYLENVTATEMGKQVVLTCEATGDPTPSITWSFGQRVFAEGEQASWTRPEQHKSPDGKLVVRSDARVSALTMKFAQHTDAGQYVCTARNSIGETSQRMHLEVLYAPKIQGVVTVYTWEGNAANISCKIQAHPADVSVVWLREGLQLPHANITNIKVFNTPSTSYLQVTPESQNDFGSYNCTASNEIGMETKEFILIQADVPSAPAITQVEAYSSSAQLLFEEPEASGGVPVLKYRAEWRSMGRGNWVQRVYEVREGLNAITVSGLKPETNYEVKMWAINGKGEGEASQPAYFKTEPVREPNPPKLDGTLLPEGNALKLNWVKQDDGGLPIMHYLVRYRAREEAEWKPEIRLPSVSEHVQLIGLAWDTEYDVFVIAENQQGKSLPSVMSFRTAPKPAATADSLGEGVGLNMGMIAGILVAVLLLLLVVLDVTCYFLNKCGLLMCIAVNMCGRAAPSSKGKDMEAGKAAFSKDESKTPIVEVRSEEEHTANHDAGSHAEPNETTPLTEPERVADAAAIVDLPLSVATNSEPVTETFDLSQSSPTSESTSLAAPPIVPEPKAAPAPQPGPPKASPPPPPSSSKPTPKEAPLVDLSDSLPTEANVTVHPSRSRSKPGAPSTRTPPSPALAPDPPVAPDLAAQTPPAQSFMHPVGPQSDPPARSLNHQLQIDGPPPPTPDPELPQDGSRALGTVGTSDPSVPAHGQTIVENERAPDTKPKKAQPEAEAEPNEVPHTNSVESKA